MVGIAKSSYRVHQRWAAVGPLTRQLPLPIYLSHSVPSVVKETARRYEGCHDGLAVLASSRLASRGIPDNADESGKTPSLRVSDFSQRWCTPNRARNDRRCSNNRPAPLLPEPHEIAVARRCVIDYIETEFVFFSSYQYESDTNGFLAFNRLN